MDSEIGTLVTWLDGRGFGFIRPVNGQDGDRDCFVPSTAFPAGTIPQRGMRLTFTRGLGTDGRVRAFAVALDETGQ